MATWELYDMKRPTPLLSAHHIPPERLTAFADYFIDLNKREARHIDDCASCRLSLVAALKVFRRHPLESDVPVRRRA